MAQCSDDDSPAGSLFSGDENPTAHCTDSPVLPPHIGLTSPPYQVAQQNDSAFLKDDSPLFSDDETHAAASTSSPVRFPLMDLTNEVSICRTFKFCYIDLLNIQRSSLVESLARGTEAWILSFRSDQLNDQKLR